MFMLGGIIGGSVAKWLKQPVRQRRLMSLCGMAAGVGSFFGAGPTRVSI